MFNDALSDQIYEMMEEAIQCEVPIAEDVLSGEIAGMGLADVREYLEFCADQRLTRLGMPVRYGAKSIPIYGPARCSRVG